MEELPFGGFFHAYADANHSAVNRSRNPLRERREAGQQKDTDRESEYTDEGLDITGPTASSWWKN
jgi:hypothetical protein